MFGKPEALDKEIPLLAIYSSTLSANGRKPLALANYLDLPFQFEEVNVYQGAGSDPHFKTINPQGKIPTLRDGEFILWESGAILQYLAEKVGKKELIGKSMQARVTLSKWLLWEASTLQPTMSQVMAAHVGHRVVPQYVPEPNGTCEWVGDQIKSVLGFLDNELEGKRFIYGESLTIADFALAGIFTYARFCCFPFSGYQNIRAWYEGIEAMNCWQKTANPLWEGRSS